MLLSSMNGKMIYYDIKSSRWRYREDNTFVFSSEKDEESENEDED